MPNEFVAFIDWNGTLLADTAISARMASHFIQQLGGRPLNIGEFRRFFDVPFTRLYEQAGCDMERFKAIPPHSLTQMFGEKYEPIAARARTRQGARDLLSWLHINEVRVVILSNHDRKSIERNARRLSLSSMISHISSRDDGEAHDPAHSRGKGQRAARYLERQGISPAQAVVIGDTPEEAHIAHELGGDALSILISGGYSTHRRLGAAKPHHLVHRLDSIRPILAQHWKLPMTASPGMA